MCFEVIVDDARFTADIQQSSESVLDCLSQCPKVWILDQGRYSGGHELGPNCL